MKQIGKLRFKLFLLFIPCWVQVLAQSPASPRAFIEVPFELIHGTILIPATVNGAGPFWMMLDTGADPSIVDLGVAKRAGLKIAAKGKQGSGGGTSHNLSYGTSLPLLRIGGLTATKVDALAMDLSGLSATLGRSLGGALGYSLFKGRIVQIDYPNRRVRFYKRAPSCTRAKNLHPKQCTILSFRYQDDILANGVAVDGKPVTTNFDTGSNSSFQLNPAAVEKLGVGEDLARAQASSSRGFNGELNNREGTVRNVSVGKISVDDAPIVFFGKGMGVDKEPWDLRIGSGFLKDFAITLDFRHGQIILSRPEIPEPESSYFPVLK
jgi:predicted aspartyl protease